MWWHIVVCRNLIILYVAEVSSVMIPFSYVIILIFDPSQVLFVFWSLGSVGCLFCLFSQRTNSDSLILCVALLVSFWFISSYFDSCLFFLLLCCCFPSCSGVYLAHLSEIFLFYQCRHQLPKIHLLKLPWQYPTGFAKLCLSFHVSRNCSISLLISCLIHCLFSSILFTFQEITNFLGYFDLLISSFTL